MLTLNTFISITPSKFERILPVAPGVEIEKMLAGELELTVRKQFNLNYNKISLSKLLFHL